MDCLRWAKRRNIPFRLPERFPLNSLKAARGALVLGRKPCLVPYIHACFRAYWVEGKDLFQEETLGEIVTELGEDAERFFAAIGAEPIKQRLREETEVAFQRGVFGAPTFFYGSEMVWGNDRLPLLEEIIREDRAVV